MPDSLVTWLALIGTGASMATAAYSLWRIREKVRAEQAMVHDLVFRLRQDRTLRKLVAASDAERARLTGEHVKLQELYRELVEKTLQDRPPRERRRLEEAILRNSARGQLNYLQKLYEETVQELEALESAKPRAGAAV